MSREPPAVLTFTGQEEIESEVEQKFEVVGYQRLDTCTTWFFLYGAPQRTHRACYSNNERLIARRRDSSGSANPSHVGGTRVVFR